MASTSSIRLELNTLKILRKRERWRLYFILVTESPDDPNEMALTVMPHEGCIRLTRRTDNEVHFEPKGRNTEGLFILERAMPADETVKVGLYLMQSRGLIRGTGTKIGEVTKVLTTSGAASKVITSLGAVNPWVGVAKLAGVGIQSLASILSKVKDRQLGFISMDEDFSNNKGQSGEFKRNADFYSGNAHLNWSWIVKD